MEDAKQKLNLYKNDTALLVEAGYVALKQVDEENAKRCFYAAMVIDPDECMPVIGLGTLHLFKLELEEAKELFNLVLQKDPNNQMAKTMHGIANLYTISEEGLKDGSEMIEDAMGKTKDPELKKLGKYTDALHKEIKKKMKDLHPLEMGVKRQPKKRLD